MAQFGPGMLADDAGLAALERLGARSSAPASMAGTSPSTSMRSMPAGGWSLAMSEPDGLALETAVAAVATIAASGPVLGFGATAAMVQPDIDLDPTVDAIAALAAAALA